MGYPGGCKLSAGESNDQGGLPKIVTGGAVQIKAHESWGRGAQKLLRVGLGTLRSAISG